MPLLCILTTNAHYTRTTATEANNAGTRLFFSSPRLDLDWVFHFLPLIPLFILHSLHRLIPLLPHYLPEGKQDPLIHFHPLSTQLLLHSDLTRSSSSGVNLERSPSETVLVQVSQVSARCHSVFSFSFLGRVCVCVSVVIFFFLLSFSSFSSSLLSLPSTDSIIPNNKSKVRTYILFAASFIGITVDS